MKEINQDKIVKKQYSTANNLNTRISIHEKYSTNKLGFGNWIFSNYNIVPNIEILELGCGTGEMWKSKLQLLNKETKLRLTDFSEGMIVTSKENLGKHSNVEYDVVNIENIPYENNRFDRVIANMMLYHVPNLDKGLSEVKRVLKDDGYFYCATYGENGIIEYIESLVKECNADNKTSKSFTLQNGMNILKKYFSKVQRLDYEDSLAVTNIEDLLDYVYSLTIMTSVTKVNRNVLKNILEKEMTNGVLNVPKEYGMFICRK